MKTNYAIIAVLLIIQFGFQACTKDNMKIEGSGPVVTQTLELEAFDAIDVEGVSDVHIEYGPGQKVEVRGQANIISRIKRTVKNNTWNIALENGNYGHFELSYYITLPYLHQVENSGTGNIYIESPMSQSSFKVSLEGTGNFYGFLLEVQNCEISTVGTGDVEISASTSLYAVIEGSGDVYYKGNPNIQTSITGSGKIVNAN